MLDRRELLKRAGMAALATGLASHRALALDTVTLPFDNGERPLARYPQKRPMIGLTERPPQLETPFAIFNDGPITPNNAFFVRYHLADVPYNIDPDKFTLETSRDAIEIYTFNSHNIRHQFCRTCGCAPFGEGKGPGGEAVVINLRCTDGVDLEALTIQQYDGASS